MTQLSMIEQMSAPRIRYRLTNRQASSAKLGVCEICQQWVSEVWFLVEELIVPSRLYSGSETYR